MQLEEITDHDIHNFKAAAEAELEKAQRIWQNNHNGLSKESAKWRVFWYRYYLKSALNDLRLSQLASKGDKAAVFASSLRLRAGRLKLRMQAELLQLQGKFSEALQAEHIALNKAT